MANISHLKYIYKLWDQLEKKQREEILLLILLNLVISIIEIINVATIIPIISIVIKGEGALFDNALIQRLTSDFPLIKEYINIKIFIYLFIISNTLMFLLRIIIIAMQNKVAYKIGESINNKIYNELLNLNFLEYKLINSSEHLTLITSKSQSIIVNTIQPLINMIGLSIISFFLIYLILEINKNFGIVIIMVAIISYGLIVLLTKKVQNKNSKIIDKNTTDLVKIINESFGSIKDVIINNHKKYFMNKYSDTNNKLKQAQSDVNLIGNLPRPIVEYFLLIVVIIYLIWLFEYGEGKIEELTGIIAVLYSVQRLIPLIQQIYYNYNSVKSSKTTLITVLDAIERKKIIVNNNINFELKFNKSIKFENVSFKYPNTEKWILKNINCEIFKGETVGLTGKSGSGKTTFIDLLIGLISPTSGKIFVDDIEITENNNYLWHEKISHVPQKIYLADDTIIKNIAFGINEKNYDLDRINKSVATSHLNKITDEFDKSLDTYVGERADKISGGQIQRIALARAFYKDFEVIILDEATNALDKITETEIIKSIKKVYSNKTIVIISHDKELLLNCDKVINIMK